MEFRSERINTYERDIFMVSLFFCGFHTIFNKSLSPSLPLSFSPPYIYVQYFTQSCVNIQVIYRHYLSISLVLSILSYLSCLIYPLISSLISIIFIINIPYIYLPYNLYTHDHICSIFIVDYVII